MKESNSNGENKIKIVMFKVGKDPEVSEMKNTVKGMQKAIGGYVQVLNVGAGSMVILCDEEGLMKNLRYNRGLLGDWLIVGSREEEFISLTEEQIEWIKNNIDRIELAIISKFR
jgi:hypothetical protein